MAQDSSLPGFWDTRYRGGTTPWDAGGVPPQLLHWLETAVPRKVLIPGCGTGYEVRAFIEHRHDVTAIEFSDAAIEAAKRELGTLADRLKQADFFSFVTASFDLIYERAFLCALPRRVWPQWATRVADLLHPGGELAGFFYFDDNERGPPFGISAARLVELLSPAFELTQDLAIPDEQSLPVFKSKERWQVWTRRL
ncbi:MAG TPA: methyltransferase [Burkholderiales bacterium]|nr:methyltransferase [Burkholderiales bacterium]